MGRRWRRNTSPVRLARTGRHVVQKLFDIVGGDLRHQPVAQIRRHQLRQHRPMVGF